MSITSTTISNVPFRTVRTNPLVVSIEKHYGGMNPNCGMIILVLVIAIILPASLAGVAPVASILLLIGSTFFPGIPLLLVNKMWRIDIDNANRDLKIVRWHEFNKVNKQTTHVKFDEIREIVAETSLDGTKRRLVAILLTGTRHLLYESMNMTHADRFKNELMGSIQLQTSQTSQASTRVTTQATTQTTQSPPPDTRSSGPANPAIVVPSLRQFAIPDPGTAPGVDAGKQDMTPNHPISVSSMIDDDVDDVSYVDDAGSSTGTQDEKAAPDSPAAVIPGGQGTGTPPQEDAEAVHQRLVEIAHRKREILSRVFIPGSELEMVPSNPASFIPGTPAGKAACSPLRNREDWYNEFDDCHGIGYLFSPELGGRRPAATSLAPGSIEVRAGRAPKKKAGEDEDEEEIITHSVDRKTEKELGVQKIRPTCMVCTIPLKGTTFICPTCETKYCIRCARTLAERKESCWVCRRPLRREKM
jgi:hypothetical protein